MQIIIKPVAMAWLLFAIQGPDVQDKPRISCQRDFYIISKGTNLINSSLFEETIWKSIRVTSIYWNKSSGNP